MRAVRMVGAMFAPPSLDAMRIATSGRKGNSSGARRWRRRYAATLRPRATSPRTRTTMAAESRPSTHTSSRDVPDGRGDVKLIPE
jgi:hypothetical protein